MSQLYQSPEVITIPIDPISSQVIQDDPRKIQKYCLEVHERGKKFQPQINFQHKLIKSHLPDKEPSSVHSNLHNYEMTTNPRNTPFFSLHGPEYEGIAQYFDPRRTKSRDILGETVYQKQIFIDIDEEIPATNDMLFESILADFDVPESVDLKPFDSLGVIELNIATSTEAEINAEDLEELLYSGCPVIQTKSKILGKRLCQQNMDNEPNSFIEEKSFINNKSVSQNIDDTMTPTHALNSFLKLASDPNESFIDEGPLVPTAASTPKTKRSEEKRAHSSNILLKKILKQKILPKTKSGCNNNAESKENGKDVYERESSKIPCELDENNAGDATTPNQKNLEASVEISEEKSLDLITNPSDKSESDNQSCQIPPSITVTDGPDNVKFDEHSSKWSKMIKISEEIAKQNNHAIEHRSYRSQELLRNKRERSLIVREVEMAENLVFFDLIKEMNQNNNAFNPFLKISKVSDQTLRLSKRLELLDADTQNGTDSLGEYIRSFKNKKRTGSNLLETSLLSIRSLKGETDKATEIETDERNFSPEKPDSTEIAPEDDRGAKLRKLSLKDRKIAEYLATFCTCWVGDNDKHTGCEDNYGEFLVAMSNRYAGTIDIKTINAALSVLVKLINCGASHTSLTTTPIAATPTPPSAVSLSTPTVTPSAHITPSSQDITKSASSLATIVPQLATTPTSLATIVPKLATTPTSLATIVPQLATTPTFLATPLPQLATSPGNESLPSDNIFLRLALFSAELLKLLTTELSTDIA